VSVVQRRVSKLHIDEMMMSALYLDQHMYRFVPFFATYPALRSKSNVWLDRNHDTNSMTKWINMSTRGLLLK
jgi:hypothetical protein